MAMPPRAQGQWIGQTIPWAIPCYPVPVTRDRDTPLLLIKGVSYPVVAPDNHKPPTPIFHGSSPAEASRSHLSHDKNLAPEIFSFATEIAAAGSPDRAPPATPIALLLQMRVDYGNNRGNIATCRRTPTPMPPRKVLL